jgi:glycosyltransferase involved in cell wall biosynthesis
MKKLSVHVIVEHGADMMPYGVAYIRDILPLMHPLNSPAFRVTHSTGYARANIVIVERTWRPNVTLRMAQELVARIRQDGACFVYSIDDNLLDLEAFPIETRMVMRYFCREADGICVSTEFLKQRLAHINDSIDILPNALDEQLFTRDSEIQFPADSNSRKIIIGYMGTFTHDSDLMMILQSLRSILRKYQEKVELQMVGGITGQTFIQSLQGLPVRVLHVPTNDVAYPNFVMWMKKNLNWDLAIAPLENNYFNRSKSDIKFLDYSALGIPGIYSRVPAYLNTIRHMDTGLLVHNSPEAWVEALDLLLADEPLRRHLAQNAQEYVFSKRMLQDCAINWQDTIQTIYHKTIKV